MSVTFSCDFFTFYKVIRIESSVHHCVKSVRIRSYYRPYSVRTGENTYQKNSEYGHFSRSEKIIKLFLSKIIERIDQEQSSLQIPIWLSEKLFY